MQVWVEYDGAKKKIDVTFAPIVVDKPHIPLLSLKRDLSMVFNKIMYVGISSSTGSFLTSHYVLGWSFAMNGQAQEIVLTQLPKLPQTGGKKRSNLVAIGVPVMLGSVWYVDGTRQDGTERNRIGWDATGRRFRVTFGLIYGIRRRKKFAELLEDRELQYGPQKCKYKELYIATKGFMETELMVYVCMHVYGLEDGEKLFEGKLQ
ncbi:hypothetical protein ACFX15_009344 [Malus domestica]